MSSKKAYEQKLQARLDEWAADIDKLKAKAERADADARIKLDDNIREAQAMKRKVENQLDELRSTTDDAWSDIKHGIDRATDTLSASLKSAFSRFA